MHVPQASFDQMGPVFSLLDQHGVQRLGEEYLADGSLQLEVSVKQAKAAQLQSEMMNATSGSVQMTKAGKEQPG